jgi:hypothetical protein
MRLDVLVLAGQVDPEQHAAELAVRRPLVDLVGPDALGVPDTPPGPEEQQRTLGQPCPLRRPARAGAVARADRALDHVPQVVEPPVRVLGVHLGDLGRKTDASFMDEDERVDLLVADVGRGQGFEHGKAEDFPCPGVLHQGGVSFTDGTWALCLT